MTDDADWDAPFWTMRHEVLESLVETLEAIGAAVAEGFTAAALWDREHPRQEQVVSLEQLIAKARDGRLGTRTRYYVPSRLGSINEP